MSKKTKIVIAILLLVIIASFATAITLILTDKPEAVEEEEEDVIPRKVKITLSSMCSNVNSRGSYGDENGVCENFVCTSDYKGSSYTLDCKTEEYGKVKPLSNTLKANQILETACSNVNSHGNYGGSGSYTIDCQDFICEVIIDGKSYTKDCTVN